VRTPHETARHQRHCEGLIDGFTKRYGLKRLVHYETHQSIATAIQREKAMKHWSRAWKVRLILAANPGWDDLFETLPFQELRRKTWMAGTSPAMTFRGDRSKLPRLTGEDADEETSTPHWLIGNGMDRRVKPGDDGRWWCR
jgi:putative endonuclease